MMSNRKSFALVTGANRGIGLEVVKQLAVTHRCILCSRSLPKGRAALQELVSQGFSAADIFVVQLDLDDHTSIEAAKERVAEIIEQGDARGLDVFINNAALVSYEFSVDAVQKSIRTNFMGTVTVTSTFLPLVAEGGRIIFVSSAVGKTYLLPSVVSQQLLGEEVTETELRDSMLDIQKQVEMGTFEIPPKNVGGIAYGIGKLGGTTLYPRILARKLQNTKQYVTSCCPAFDGPNTIVWLATTPLALIQDGHGGFWEQRELTDPSDFQSGMQTTFAKTGQYPPGHM